MIANIGTRHGVGPDLEFDTKVITVIRVEKEKTLTDFGKEIKKSIVHVSQVVNNKGRDRYPLQFAILLAEYLGVSWEKLVKNPEIVSINDLQNAIQSERIHQKRNRKCQN